MTNREKLAAMSNRDLAMEICSLMIACGACPGFELCTDDDGAANGLIKWLDAEEEQK